MAWARWRTEVYSCDLLRPHTTSRSPEREHAQLAASLGRSYLGTPLKHLRCHPPFQKYPDVGWSVLRKCFLAQRHLEENRPSSLVLVGDQIHHSSPILAKQPRRPALPSRSSPILHALLQLWQEELGVELVDGGDVGEDHFHHLLWDCLPVFGFFHQLCIEYLEDIPGE